MEHTYRTSSVVFMPGGLLMDMAAKRDTNRPEEGEATRRPEEQRFSDSVLSSGEVERADLPLAPGVCHAIDLERRAPPLAGAHPDIDASRHAIDVVFTVGIRPFPAPDRPAGADCREQRDLSGAAGRIGNRD